MTFILYIPAGWEMLVIALFVIMALILYVISIIINFIKFKKLKIYTKTNKILIAIILLIILPVLYISINILENKYLIKNSDLVVVYESRGNGGFGDGDTFAYSIGKNGCNQFDLGIDAGGDRLKEYLPKNAVEIDYDKYINDYEIIFEEDNSTLVYKGKKKICKINNKKNYFNIEFQKGFYLKH